ncbi:MAG TPA: amidohydrolase family protein [Tepidisphaeraceae bacterium]|jgi:cytosine/adenosine deaminase-related metal-dependent hydrolase|nr:amidohydrolase family protein [Tepidisphaeraceae bacterium]
MAGPPFRDGGVVFSAGLIDAVGSAGDLQRKYPDAIVEDVGESVILPGLMNAHAHLELSHIRRGDPPNNLAEWIEKTLMPQTAATGHAAADAVCFAMHEGVAQCLRFGVTSVGDISKQCMHSRPALRDGPLRVVSYGEIQAMAQRRGLLEERFASAADISCESNWLRVGVTPHAPYTVEPAGYARCLAFAKSQKRPLATHLAETADEANFLASHSGPFRHLWEVGVNAWDDAVPRFAGGPIRFARDLGLLDYPTLLAHVNYCDDDELAVLARGKASVVFCPRTHAFFGHPPHRWRDMLARGINVAVGTDSCASSPDLNLVDDLRLLHRLAPEVPAVQLWEMGTTRAARALGWNRTGAIRAGDPADFVAFGCATADPLREILDREVLPTSIWIGGKRIR